MRNQGKVNAIMRIPQQLGYEERLSFIGMLMTVYVFSRHKGMCKAGDITDAIDFYFRAFPFM